MWEGVNNEINDKLEKVRELWSKQGEEWKRKNEENDHLVENQSA